MLRSAWIPNSTDIWLEKEELIVSTVWLLYWCATKSGSWNFVFIITFYSSQPHQRAAQGDRPHPPRQWEKQLDPHWGGSPGCAGSQEGAAWAGVTHGEYKPGFEGVMLRIGSSRAVVKDLISCRRMSVQRTWSSNSVFTEPSLAKKGRR